MTIVLKKNLGQIFTPKFLVNDMLDKLPEDVWKNPNNRWLDPACGDGNFLVEILERLMVSLSDIILDEEERRNHVLTNMIFGVDIDFSLCQQARQRLSCPNIYCTDSLNYDFKFDNRVFDGKFDVIVGNPPYNPPMNQKGIRNILWDKFVKLSIDLLKDKGYLVFVHPSGWRGYGKFLKHTNDILTKYQMLYLEMHNAKDGLKVFGCQTTYDWYVLQKVLNHKKTLVKGQDGSLKEMLIENNKFLPNGMFDEIGRLIAEDGEEKVQLLIDNSCHTQRKHMSKFKTAEFKYPCVYAVNVKGEPKFWYSSKPVSSYNLVPKLIFSGGLTGIYAKKYFLDNNSEYGLTQFAWGIVDTPENLEKIEKAMTHPKFKEILWYCIIGKGEINKSALAVFRKDFWKDFI